VPEQVTKMMVPMEVHWTPAWLTWVGATTTCLRALGLDCDAVDVAGMSGYAFMLSVHKELCPSGPTVFDWGMLLEGLPALGRATEVFEGRCEDRGREAFEAQRRAVYDLAAREVAAGRPCVLWGAYLPEFAVVMGVEDGAYHVKSYRECTREPQPPIPYREMDAPGPPYVLAFPAPTAGRTPRDDARAVERAAHLLRAPHHNSDYGSGLGAYDVWIEALQADRAHPFGNAYNAQCYAEGRRFAHGFLTRVAERNPAVDALRDAVAAYGEAALAMDQVSGTFPFPGGEAVREAGRRGRAIELLQETKAAETRAADALAQAAAGWPRSQPS
jgi:hypothetical protein